MHAALLTALFFGITPVCANRAIRALGVSRANLWRLLLALLALGAWAFLFGQGLAGPFWWFFIAGAIGFGLGGMAMFQALPLLGAPLSSLIVESMAALFAANMAWFWFADPLTAEQIIFGLLVLLGVSMGLLPYINGNARQANAARGAAWAVLAALGQAASITISRKALLAMKAAGVPPDLATAAFQRLTGGACVALALWLAWRASGAKPTPKSPSKPLPKSWPASRPWFWVTLNALFGPILGVTCLIWALKSMQPGLVQAVAATAPLVSVPFVRWLEGHKPPPLYYAGAAAAIAGLAGIHLTH